MFVKDVMTPMPHTIGASQNVGLARKMMREHGVRHLPVKERGVLIGIISERDLFFADRLEPENSDSLLASDICTLDPEVFAPGTPLKDVVAVMAEKGFGCALVVEGDSLEGIFTTTDACRVLHSLLMES